MGKTFAARMRERVKDREYNQERAILEATELIQYLMERQGVKKTDLATLLGTTKSSVTQMLCGDRNFTLRSLSDVLFALGHTVEMHSRPFAEPKARCVALHTVVPGAFEENDDPRDFKSAIVGNGIDRSAA